MKHALLVWLLLAMRRKPTPFLVLDTHAGIGRYDLTSAQAERTGEANFGIFRLLEPSPERPLADYLTLVRSLGLYPGSPALARALLRAEDRLICCELHPDDHAALKSAFAGDWQVAIHHRDGFDSVRAFLPPPQKRALVLFDPPYEAANDFSRLASALQSAHARFPSGVLAAWYPIKHRAPVRAFHTALTEAKNLRDVVAAEFLLREPLDAARLNGCGMVVVNPPYRFEAETPEILAALLARLGAREPGDGISVRRLIDE
jgi:23S rRNA (adenine2030-N6)-methyltransferase